MEKQSQAARLFQLLSDYREHSTIEILEKIYGGEHLGLARIGARVYDIKKKYKAIITSRRDTLRPTICWYRMKPLSSNSMAVNIINEESRKMREARDQKNQNVQLGFL
ncbi:MAG: hypothetical protein AAB456_01585 [Patescibacteria group bacterium]